MPRDNTRIDEHRRRAVALAAPQKVFNFCTEVAEESSSAVAGDRDEGRKIQARGDADRKDVSAMPRIKQKALERIKCSNQGLQSELNTGLCSGMCEVANHDTE